MTHARTEQQRFVVENRKRLDEMYCVDRIGWEKNEVDMAGSGDGWDQGSSKAR